MYLPLSEAPPAASCEPKGPAITKLQGLYVLLVEDDDLVRNSTALLLESQGMIVEVADSLESADALI